jgi:hypothetical protein
VGVIIGDPEDPAHPKPLLLAPLRCGSFVQLPGLSDLDFLYSKFVISSVSLLMNGRASTIF